jgi:cobalt-zinc-cadmium efflux system membrane fusion protein
MNFSFLPLARQAFALAFLLPAIVSAADEFPVSAAQMQALGISLQRVDAGTEIRGLTYPARVILPPEQQYVLSAPVAGSVEQLLVEENQRVKSGQPLIRLASPEFGQLQISALEAANGDRIARQTLDRERQLFAEGIVPQRRVAAAEAAAAESQARIRMARAGLRVIGVNDAAIARLLDGGATQESLVLYAKRGGIVSGLNAKPGERVAAADPLLHITDASRLWLDIQIPAERANNWSKDQSIGILGRTATAKAIRAGSVVNEGQSVSLRAQVISGTDQLRPGEFVQVQVPFSSSADTWTLPLPAIARQGDMAYVFVRTSKGFAARAVTVINSAGQSVSVKGEIKAGDQVAVTSVIALKAAWLGESGGS